MTNKKKIDSKNFLDSEKDCVVVAVKKPTKSRIPKNTYDPTNGKLWKRVVRDILSHFGMVGSDGIPVFKSLTLFPSDYNTMEFTYGFARKLCDTFEERGYFTDIEHENCEVTKVIVGIEPIIDSWDFI